MSTTKLSLTSTLPLPNSKVQIPRLGFGVYESPRDVCIRSCLAALKAGYRHIDSAIYYANEAEVGEAVAQCGVARSELFLTSKLLFGGKTVDESYAAVIESIEKMGGKGGYTDLFLIHSPNAGSAARKNMWLALERAYAEGRTKAIGVSNFGVGHIEELKQYATTWPPHVNQVELHPWCQQRECVSYCQKQGIVVEAYCPIVRNQKAKDKTLVSLAQKYNKSPSQVLIRYCLQKDWVPLPKSDTPSRIVENADIYDFEIDAQDMKTMDDLDDGAKGSIVQAVDNN